MNYCINFKCQNRQNSDLAKQCQTCGTNLLINHRYRLLKPLRSLTLGHPTEIFEAEDWGTGEQEWGTRKVIKVLKFPNNTNLLQLFKQEARVLIWLRNPAIPRVAPDGYFSILFDDNSQQFPCLAMEKILGENLALWLEKNQHISQEIAINWLQQLTEILCNIHSYQIIHRDIKPSNIILQPNGKLALIDFGSVKIENSENIPVGSLGYAAPEQIAGKAVPQSDFFALGRTLVHLLTGQSPLDFPINQGKNQIIWYNSSINIEKSLANLLNKMMNSQPEKRPKNTRSISKSLNNIKIR
ncbi:serine/threonine protein kinase [Oscillatoriales cyanobacterium USR001]|nr:serine/threonine protein kinase [Oscillatoriales cyanobacterium USR001]